MGNVLGAEPRPGRGRWHELEGARQFSEEVQRALVEVQGALAGAEVCPCPQMLPCFLRTTKFCEQQRGWLLAVNNREWKGKHGRVQREGEARARARSSV